MNNSNSNSVIKTVLIIIIGIFGISLLHNFLTGSGSAMAQGGHMSNMGAIGYSFTGIISWILMIFIRILLMVLVVVAVLGIYRWIKETFFANTDIQIYKIINSDPVLKAVTTLTLIILGLVLLSAILNGMLQPGMNMGGIGHGYSPTLGIAGLLAMLIRILTFILIVSLVLAVAMYLKNQYESGALRSLFETPERKIKIILNESAEKTDGNKDV
jgi:hypothetical protein